MIRYLRCVIPVNQAFRRRFSFKRSSIAYQSLNIAQCQTARMYATQSSITTKLIQSQELMNEAQKLLELGSTEMAMEAYMQAHQIYPSAIALYNMGNIYFQMGRIDDSRESWRKSIGMDDKHADVYVNLGNLELGFGKDPLKAIELYEKALQLCPQDGEIRFNLAMAYEKHGQLEIALKQYEESRKYLESLLAKNDHENSSHLHDPEMITAKLNHLDRLVRNVKAKLLADPAKSSQ